MQLSIASRSVGARRVVVLDGLADLASVPELQSALRREVLRSPGSTVLVDIDGLTGVDDVALGVLLGAAASARELGGDLEVVTVSERWRERFRTTGFEHAVAIRSSVV